ncbi:DUF6119 family protein [Aquitalea pelogenes]|uniref:DUF6119 family protein n=1 Tax=Aquitalea pelogenes TaxID=1293573 RepID=UPI001379EAC7|nr:DUF6119 family protein [Aquitalea pelogenes]
MKNQYNIYRIEKNKIKQLLLKIKSSELVILGVIRKNNYNLRFYFSEKPKGTPVPWWNSFSSFTKTKNYIPENVFHYGLLIATPKDKSENYIFIASFGKSHFYLNKLIDRDFGISFAIRAAKNDSILLKKSRYFTGIKKGDIASYQKFNQTDFIAGESVDHLKLTLKNKKTWGEGSIICSDSIQISLTKNPDQFDEIIDCIKKELQSKITMEIPKLEKENNPTTIKDLNENLLKCIKDKSASVSITEFNIFGPHIYISSDILDYELIHSNKNKILKSKTIGNNLTIGSISDFISSENIIDIDNIKVKMTDSNGDKFKKSIKEALDFRMTLGNDQYITKNGDWYYFNEKFLDFLKKSLAKIPLVKKKNLYEKQYVKWKIKKENEIAAGTAKDKITYREYYFNEEMAKTGYQLFDRATHTVKTMAAIGNNYRVEMADLYHNNEIISLKISDDKMHLIYNITQSITALELYCQETIKTTYNIKIASIWIVHPDDIGSIFDLNSIQLLLAIENWRQKAASYGLETKIYISKHVK